MNESDNPVRKSFIDSPQYQTAATPPVIRSMDVSRDYRVPGSDMTFDQILKMGDELSASAGLFTRPQEVLLSPYNDVQRLEALANQAREVAQYNDISRIAANAVRRHPEREITTIGVMHGLQHREVAERVLGEAPGKMVLVPPRSNGERSVRDDYFEAYRQQRSKGEVEPALARRLLLARYALNVIIAHDSDEATQEQHISCLGRANAALSDMAVDNLLDRIETAKAPHSRLAKYMPDFHAARRYPRIRTILQEMITLYS